MDAREQPTFTAILDWLEGRLDSEAANLVERSIAAGDEKTIRTLGWLRGFIDTTRSHPLHQPPPLVRQRLRQHFADWSRARRPLDRPLEEFSSALLFDSRRDLALTGVRAADDADETAHLAYTSEVADLVVDASRTEPGDFGSRARSFRWTPLPHRSSKPSSWERTSRDGPSTATTWADSRSTTFRKRSRSCA